MTEGVTRSAERNAATLDLFRTIGLVILFVGLPLWMVPHTRAAPAFLGYFSLALLIGHALTRFAFVDHAYLAILKRPVNWTPMARAGAVLLAGLTVWTALALIWAPSLEEGLDEMIWLSMAVIACAFLIVPELKRAKAAMVWGALAIGGLAGAAFVLAELAGITHFHTLLESQARPYDLNRNAGFLCLIFWLLFLIPRRTTHALILAGLAAIAILAAVFQSQSQSAQLAIMVSIPAAAAIWLMPRLVNPGYLAMAALILAMPILVHPAISPDITQLGGKGTAHFLKEAHFDHRLGLWQGYGERALENLLLGSGAGADKVMGLAGAIGDYAAAAGYPPEATNPHNAPLEIWVNYGLVGALLAAALMVWAGLFNVGLVGTPRIVFCALVVSVFAYSLTASSFFQAWWIGSIATAFSAFLALYRNRLEDRD